ncbi:hypothetical protein AAGG74_15290 [Bacillus mexicanus]|uniref:hypothetical protein n=1 Tax=Bacillus mexicanus TaxID=2834415 RepID=UPI003D24BEE5
MEIELKKAQNELEQAQELLKKFYEDFGKHPNSDFFLWVNVEEYLKEKKLINTNRNYEPREGNERLEKVVESKKYINKNDQKIYQVKQLATRFDSLETMVCCCPIEDEDKIWVISLRWFEEEFEETDQNCNKLDDSK